MNFKRVRKMMAALSVAVLALTFYLAGNGCKGETESGPVAPSFSLPDIDGKIISLEDFRGSPVLIDFWATWCPPCRMSIPELVRLQEEYREKGLVILGLSMDDPDQAPDSYLRAFKEKYKINYPILRVNRQVILDYFGLETPAIPTMFVVDANGRVVSKIVGFRPRALRDSIRKLIEG